MAEELSNTWTTTRYGAMGVMTFALLGHRFPVIRDTVAKVIGCMLLVASVTGYMDPLWGKHLIY